METKPVRFQQGTHLLRAFPFISAAGSQQHRIKLHIPVAVGIDGEGQRRCRHHTQVAQKTIGQLVGCRIAQSLADMRPNAELLFMPAAACLVELLHQAKHIEHGRGNAIRLVLPS